MKNRSMLSRVPTLAIALVAALLTLAGTYVALASPAETGLDSATSSSSAAVWGRWVTILPGQCRGFTHNLGRDPEDLTVELMFLDEAEDGLGLHRRYYGGLEAAGAWRGAYWQNLTANTIRVCRGADDTTAGRVRVRVADVPSPPDYANDWTDIGPGQTITLTHGLGITSTDLTVALWFSGTTRGIHHFGYGGLAVDTPQEMWGGHWYNLTTNTVQVVRHPNDPHIEQVRVVVVQGAPPHYDSLEVLGGWQAIDSGAAYTFTHSLNWNPNNLVIRGECYSSTLGGISQWFAGGNHDWFIGWQGANLQNLTDNTVTIFRQPDDDICPQVRVRIWRRGVQVYLPLIVSEYSSP